ncbi:histidine phosphatase family protein [Methylophilus sp. Q8]|uniref:histidine phosphatase family protein n=1 Tax=Methylophilus sp. Q8 TaxID=1506586 RepID=UPI0006460584|nr:histidine phosphatase family protein [Methylophilus sp. Q8]
MNLYVARHGETFANVEHRYLGAFESGLTEQGMAQAEALQTLFPARIDVLIVSPKLRAQQTAHILNHHLGLKLETMDCFTERDVGIFEGLTQNEASTLYPQLWARNITRQWAIGPTNGESIADVVMRVQQGLHQLQTLYATKTVLLIAHGFVAKTIRALAKGDFSDFYDWQLSNGGVLVLEHLNIPTRSMAYLESTLPPG